jgi:hypothetical protein
VRPFTIHLSNLGLFEVLFPLILKIQEHRITCYKASSNRAVHFARKGNSIVREQKAQRRVREQLLFGGLSGL